MMHSINVSIRGAVIILITFTARDGNRSEAATLFHASRLFARRSGDERRPRLT